MATKEEKLNQLRLVEEQMNTLREELTRLEDPAEEELQYEDIQYLDENIDPQNGDQQEEKHEADTFLGSNPLGQTPTKLTLTKDITDRVKIWTTKGLLSKEERSNLLNLMPRKGDINLEAPELNEELVVDILSKSLVKDNYAKANQNLAGAGLAATAHVLSMILNDQEEPIERETLLTSLSNAVKVQSQLYYDLTQSRRYHILPRYSEKIQKALKKTEPTEWLFGDNLKTIIEATKTLERVSKDLAPPAREPLRQANTNRPLNWRSSTARREWGRGSYKPQQGRTTTSKSPGNYNYSNKQKPYPAKQNYTQSQPQQQHRQ